MNWPKTIRRVLVAVGFLLAFGYVGLEWSKRQGDPTSREFVQRSALAQPSEGVQVTREAPARLEDREEVLEERVPIAGPSPLASANFRVVITQSFLGDARYNVQIGTHEYDGYPMPCDRYSEWKKMPLGTYRITVSGHQIPSITRDFELTGEQEWAEVLFEVKPRHSVFGVVVDDSTGLPIRRTMTALVSRGPRSPFTLWGIDPCLSNDESGEFLYAPSEVVREGQGRSPSRPTGIVW